MIEAIDENDPNIKGYFGTFLILGVRNTITWMIFFIYLQNYIKQAILTLEQISVTVFYLFYYLRDQTGS